MALVVIILHLFLIFIIQMNYYGNSLPPYIQGQQPRPILLPQPTNYAYPPPFPPPQDLNVPPPLPSVNPNFLQQPPPQLYPSIPPPFPPWYSQSSVTAPYYPPLQPNYPNTQHYVPEWSSFPQSSSNGRSKIPRLLPSSSDESTKPRKKPHSSSDRKSYRDWEPPAKFPEPISLTPEEIIENEKKTWTRCAPADLFYVRDESNPRLMKGTEKLQRVIDEFENELINRGKKARQSQPKFEDPPVSRKDRNHSGRCGASCKGNGSIFFITSTIYRFCRPLELLRGFI